MAKESERGGVIPTAKESEQGFGGRSLRDGDRHGYDKARDDRAFKGQGLGGALLADALERAIRSEIAASSLVVDAKEEAAADFYWHHGFIALPDLPLTLFLPLATAQRT